MPLYIRFTYLTASQQNIHEFTDALGLDLQLLCINNSKLAHAGGISGCGIEGHKRKVCNEKCHARVTHANPPAPLGRFPLTWPDW